MNTARRAFRAILAGPGVHVMPGGFSPLYAKMAEEIGFGSFFLAGSQLSAYLYGVPDTGIVGLRDLVDHARHMAARTRLPILVDGDTGFGNAVNVHYAVEEVIRTGVAALSLEDQEAPKKSATSAGRRCIPADEAIGKLRAAAAVRDAIDPEFSICARCDLIGAEGGGFDEALARSIAYVREGRADLVWLNSVETREQLARACREIPAPVLTIWGGPAPAPTIEEFGALGVRIALYPVLAANFGLQAAWHWMHEFKSRGSAALGDWAKSVNASPWGRADLRGLTGFHDVRRLEEEFLPASRRRDYASTWGHGGLLDPPQDEKK